MFSRRPARLEEIFKKRDRDRSGVLLSDAEFFSTLRSDDICLIQVEPCVRRRQWEQAAHHLLEHYRERYLPVFFFPASLRDEHSEALRQIRQATQATLEWAERVCSHTFFSPYH